jgi:hypothetical protein
MTLRRLSSVLLMMLFANLTPAYAAPITFSFTGSVTDDPFGLSSFGAPIAGSYTFDSDATDAIPDPATGSYASSGAGFDFTVTVDGTTYSVMGGVTVNTVNDVGVDQYGVIGDDGSLILELSFEDGTQTALSSDALPLVAPTISGFAFRQFRLFGEEVEFLGTINTLVCTTGCDGGGTVPEPPSPWLVSLGLAGAFLMRRKGRIATPRRLVTALRYGPVT